MSYILEALRRSEETRRRRTGPELALLTEPAAPVRSPSARALTWLAAGLLLNAIVLGVWLLRTPGAEVELAAPAPAAGQETPGARAEPVAPEAETPVAEPEVATPPPDTVIERSPPRPIGSLPGSVRDRLPALNLSTHIYADDPAFREVGINGRSYREGDIVDGLELLEITESGVLMGFEAWVIRIELRDQWGL